MYFLAGLLKCLGSKLAVSAKAASLTAAVNASLLSVSIFTFLTPFLIPSWISSTGTPYVCGISPPYLLMISNHSWGTELDPCITRWVFGKALWISAILLIARTSPVGFLVNLYAPWLVPIAMAKASTFVFATKSAASSGSVKSISVESSPSNPWPSSASPFPVSKDPKQPNSPSTLTPTECAKSTTFFVTATLYS